MDFPSRDRANARIGVHGMANTRILPSPDQTDSHGTADACTLPSRDRANTHEIAHGTVFAYVLPSCDLTASHGTANVPDVPSRDRWRPFSFSMWSGSSLLPGYRPHSLFSTAVCGTAGQKPMMRMSHTLCVFARDGYKLPAGFYDTYMRGIVRALRRPAAHCAWRGYI